MSNKQGSYFSPVKIAIAVCYDSEFPEIVRPLVRNGASIILVPSYTTPHAAIIPDLLFKPSVHVNYQGAVLRIKDGLPKMMDMKRGHI